MTAKKTANDKKGTFFILLKIPALKFPRFVISFKMMK